MVRGTPDESPAHSRASPAEARRRYLDEVLRLLWPEPVPILASRLPVRRRGSAGYLMLPNGRRPTVLVPRHPRRATASVIRHLKASASPATQRRLDVLALAARVGLTDLLPYHLQIGQGISGSEMHAGTLEHYVTEALGRRVLLSVYTSPPRANRKPVLQVLTSDGTTLGFAKIGVNPLTEMLVRAEARSLTILQDAGLRQLVTPRLLHSGRWRGHEVLIQSSLASGRSRAQDGASRQLAVAMLELACVRGLHTHPAFSSPYAQRLHTRLQGLADSTASQALRAAFANLLQQESCALPLGSWHGDWTPWNMAVRHGRPHVWDWERFETGVPLGFDALHYAQESRIVAAHTEPRAAVDATVTTAAEVLAPFGLDAHAASLVALLYLFELATRYLHDRQAEAGSARGDLQTWLLPAVRAAVDSRADLMPRG